jgi:hypothetical protein
MLGETWHSSVRLTNKDRHCALVGEELQALRQERVWGRWASSMPVSRRLIRGRAKWNVFFPDRAHRLHSRVATQVATQARRYRTHPGRQALHRRAV